MFRRGVLVLHLLGESLGALEHRPQPLAHVLAAAAPNLGQLLDRRVDLRCERLGAYAELAENRRDHAVLLRDQRVEQVLRLDRLVAALARERLRGLQRFLALDRQFVESHVPVYPCAYPRGESVLSARRRSYSSFSAAVSSAGIMMRTVTSSSPAPPPLSRGMP